MMTERNSVHYRAALEFGKSLSLFLVTSLERSHATDQRATAGRSIPRYPENMDRKGSKLALTMSIIIGAGLIFTLTRRTKRKTYSLSTRKAKTTLKESLTCLRIVAEGKGATGEQIKVTNLHRATSLFSKQ